MSKLVTRRIRLPRATGTNSKQLHLLINVESLAFDGSVEVAVRVPLADGTDAGLLGFHADESVPQCLSSP